MNSAGSLKTLLARGDSLAPYAPVGEKRVERMCESRSVSIQYLELVIRNLCVTRSVAALQVSVTSEMNITSYLSPSETMCAFECHRYI